MLNIYTIVDEFSVFMFFGNRQFFLLSCLIGQKKISKRSNYSVVSVNFRLMSERTIGQCKNIRCLRQIVSTQTKKPRNVNAQIRLRNDFKLLSELFIFQSLRNVSHQQCGSSHLNKGSSFVLVCMYYKMDGLKIFLRY